MQHVFSRSHERSEFAAAVGCDRVHVLVLQHIACEPPGTYEDVLRERGAELHRVEIDEGDPLPDWREFDAIVAMGGPMSATDDETLPWLAAEKQLIAEAVRADRSFWGVCLGVQLLAASLRAARCPAGPRGSSSRSSGTATRSTCRTAPCAWRALPRTRTRRFASRERTASSSTSRSRPAWPASGARCPSTRSRSSACSARAP